MQVTGGRPGLPARCPPDRMSVTFSTQVVLGREGFLRSRHKREKITVSKPLGLYLLYHFPVYIICMILSCH